MNAATVMHVIYNMPSSVVVMYHQLHVVSSSVMVVNRWLCVKHLDLSRLCSGG